MLGLDLSVDDPGLMQRDEIWETHDAFTSHHIIKEIEMIQNRKAEQGREHQTASKEEIPLAEKIMLLREIDIFSDLKVAELAAIAAVTEEQTAPPDQAIICQGDVGETVYMIISGRVEVSRTADSGEEVLLDTMSQGKAFGEMALLDDDPRSATITTREASRFLVLHKQAFNETVMEYPRIALQICTVLSGRIRHLHSKIEHPC